MTLTPEIETKGLKAYEQALAFERLRTWRLPLAHAVFILMPIGCGVLAVMTGHETIGVLQFFAAILFAWISMAQWSNLKVRYAKNLKVVADMERTYGEQLPWVQVNNHFAELEKLQREIAEEKAAKPLN